MRRRKDAIAHETDERTRQGGFVAVWMAMVLFVLIGVAAFAVDLVHAYLVGQQVQNAADAAALAGASQIPTDFTCGKANTSAANLANKNLTDDGLNAGSNITTNCTGPNEMTVDVSSRFDTFFARMIGFPKLTVKRRGVAQYDAKLSMGSPANNLGDIPADSCADLGFSVPPSPQSICASVPANATQNLFAQIEGPDTSKISGNAFSTNFCGAGVDGCDFTGPGGNNEFANGGDEYFYVKNDNPGQPLLIAVYDAGFVNTGGFCNTTGDPVGPPPTNPTNRIDPASLTYPLRYYTNSPYCAGDRSQNGLAGSPAMDTQFSVLAPDGDLDPTNNPVVCSTPNIAGEEPGNNFPAPPDPISPAAAFWFEQWQPICPAFGTSATQDTYIVRVHSSVGRGTNGFSLLALHGAGQVPPLNSELSISTQERLPLFAVKPGGGVGSFYLARVPGSTQARVLDLDFFDTGDSAPPAIGPQPPTSTGTITIHPDGGSTFSNCTIALPPGTSSSDPGPAPWGPQGSPQSCSFHYDNATWNGQWVSVKVPLPPAPFYTCNFADFQSCWIKIDIQPDAGSRPLSDATTWNATIGGAPVRLIG